MKNYTENISKFPISNKFGEITDCLKKSPTRFLILTAETGAGKSTVLPLGLLEEFDGKILMTEPRRLAVLGVANRVADLIGEQVGESVGYKIHLDKKISNKTRFEVVTEGILVRQLQTDPILDDYNLVVLDEFHERSINTDLALAFLKEAMELRDDLFIIIMSATIDTDKLQQYLGKETPVMKIPGRQFPVSVVYNSKSTMEQAIERQLEMGEKGNILAFLPGIKEIRKVQENLNVEKDVEICVLHSSISLSQQKNILRESDKKRVILSSAIGETSLTVPGITCVIDSGLSRVNRMNVGLGMEGLYTETESEFSAEQRKGRAGRLMAGKCIRLWSEADPRVKNMPCEILRADLSTLVLECADRGIYSVSKINWLDSPSENSWNSSLELLKHLEMIKEDGRVSEKGKIALTLGIHPRLGAIALENFDLGKKIILKYSSYSKSSKEIQEKFIEDLEKRIKNSGYGKKGKIGENNSGESTGIVCLYGFPDRLGKKISEPGVVPEIYQLPGGRKAILADGSHGGEWIVAPQIVLGAKDTVIFDFEPLNGKEVEKWLENRKQVLEECKFENGRVEKRENVCYGKIILLSKKINPEPGDLARAWINEIKEKGLDCLPLSEKSKSLLNRGEFLLENNKGPFSKSEKNKTEIKDLKEYICSKASEWLPPFLGTSKNLTENIVYDSLYWFLQGDIIEKEAPNIINLANGRKAKVKYEKLASPENKNQLIIRPVIEIIIQRIFGCVETPEIAGVKVLLRLLSPASRPLQITDDLSGFWTGAWPEICKEMKGRYPKHNWNEKICTEKD